MLFRLAAPAMLLAVVVAALPVHADIVTLPLAPQVDNGLNPPLGDNDARLKVEVFFGSGLLTPDLYADTGMSGQLIVDVARDGLGNISTIQIMPGSIITLQDILDVTVGLGPLGTVFANMTGVQLDFVQEDGTTPNAPIAMTDTGNVTPGGDKIYSGDGIGQGLLLISGTGLLQASSPSDPIWDVIDETDGNTEVDVSAFSTLLASPITLIDGITKPDRLVIDVNFILDNIINEESFALTTDLISVANLVAVPEASSMVLLGSVVGLFGAGSILRWRRRKSA